MHSPVTAWRISRGRLVDARRSPIAKRRIDDICRRLVDLYEADRAAVLFVARAEPVGPAARRAAAAFKRLRATERDFRSTFATRLVATEDAQLAADALATATLTVKGALDELAVALAQDGAWTAAKHVRAWARDAFTLTSLAKTLRAEVL